MTTAAALAVALPSAGLVVAFVAAMWHSLSGRIDEHGRRLDAIEGNVSEILRAIGRIESHLAIPAEATGPAASHLQNPATAGAQATTPALPQ